MMRLAQRTRQELIFLLDRRQRIRYPFQWPVGYSSRKTGRRIEGSGRTINISSAGVKLTTDRAVAPGDPIELRSEWPVRLEESCALQLALHGKVVRVERGLAAIETIKYEFRTKAAAASRS